MRYRDRDGQRPLESTHTEDRQEAQRPLRERLQARDENPLDIVRKGKSLTFGEGTEFFLENYSKPPIRAIKTHAANKSAVKTLRKALGTMLLIQISPLQIEAYLRARLQQRKTVRRKRAVGEPHELMRSSRVPVLGQGSVLFRQVPFRRLPLALVG